MPRPRKCRRICRLPQFTAFAPVRNGRADAESVVLTVDEFEAIRLIDFEGVDQNACAEYMQVARTTVQQIYTSARKKLAEMLVSGRSLQIKGGDIRLCEGDEHFAPCAGCLRFRCRSLVQRHIQEGTAMKTLLPLDEDKTHICPSFGRAPYFLFRDDEADVTEVLENPAADARGGAGLKAAQFVIDRGANTLITPRLGENAAEVFNAAGIAIYKSIDGDAQANLAALKAGTLDVLTHFHAGYHGLH